MGRARRVVNGREREESKRTDKEEVKEDRRLRATKNINKVLGKLSGRLWGGLEQESERKEQTVPDGCGPHLHLWGSPWSCCSRGSRADPPCLDCLPRRRNHQIPAWCSPLECSLWWSAARPLISLPVRIKANEGRVEKRKKERERAWEIFRVSNTRCLLQLPLIETQA